MPLRSESRRVPNGTQTCLHISIDFGTTFSAVAYAKGPGPGSLKDINIVGQYPGGNESSVDVNQVPTVLLYQPGQRKPVKWGWEAASAYRKKKPNFILASRFKLLLSERENTRYLREDLRKKLLIDGRTEINLIADFLAPLREFILPQICCLEENDPEFATSNHFWTLTVPADWSAWARRAMLMAAEKAGFKGPIKLISEPEAAALYILEQRANANRKLKLEDAAVVGDLGGGTSDSATFLITTLEPLSLAALGPIKGVICGAGNLADNLRRHLSSRLKDVAKQYLENRRSASLEQILDDAVENFTIDLKNFRSMEDDPELELINVPSLREDPENGFTNSGVEISKNAIRTEIFKPVVDEILQLLRDQVMASIHSRRKTMNYSQFKVGHIFLTGGLSNNSYVFKTVEAAFMNKEFIPYTIEVLRPKNPDTAVVSGAVWRSIHPQSLPQKLSDTSYGFRQDVDWKENWAHGGPAKVTNPITGRPEMQDRMMWVIKKGRGNSLGQSSYRLQRYIPIGDSLKFCETMYYSDVTDRDNIHYEAEGIHEFGKLEFDLERWRNQFQTFSDGVNGQSYMFIEYNLVSTLDSEDVWTYHIQVSGSDTDFKDSGTIAAGLKLSQGRQD